jgi:hypothetical protein
MVATVINTAKIKFSNIIIITTTTTTTEKVMSMGAQV